VTEDEFGAYRSLGEDSDDHRWAFGTGFTDPLEGVDTTVPAGVDGAALAAYCLMLGDDALIYSHRLQQWITRAPELEEEAALGNIALDLLGEARMLLARAGRADGTGRDEDRLAFFRAEGEFRNVRLVERLDLDFAELVGRLLIFSTWRLALFDRLRASGDPVLSAIAGMGVKELTYHRDYAAQWVVRLGDGTLLSQQRMQRGLDVVWPLVDELFAPHPVERSLPGVAVDVSMLRAEFDVVMDTVLATAGVERPLAPALPGVGGRTGRDGRHTEAMGYVLAELQSVARAHPEATW
jgi:ring-1,2-phenylacetyl-CoA epoxidase subunit PaaC